MGNIISVVIAYLLGSLSSAILVAKIMNLPDPRSEGSSNPGATNMLRMHDKKVAGVVLAGDAIKGLIAVWIGHLFGANDFMLGLVAVAAVLGHIFPVFFRFKGGKGVATTIGALFGFSLLLGIVAVAIWAAVAYFFRYASLASLAVAAAAPVLMLFTTAAATLPLLIITALIVWQHSANIERLKSGTETKLEF